MTPNSPVMRASSPRSSVRRWAGLILWLAFWTPVTLAQTVVCAVPGRDGTTFQPGTYYPGLGTAPALARTLMLGAARTGTDAGTAPLVSGDLVFIIQMQDASIDSSDSVNYGNGSTGRGYTNLNASGVYEFAVVESVSGSAVTLRDPLKHSYGTAAATTTTTQRRFQVIRTPQHAGLSLSGSLSGPAWDGTTGGVFVLDVAGALNLGNAEINMSAKGFRGGGLARQEALSGQSITSYAQAGIPGYGSTDAKPGGTKGEGIAGTPRLVANPGGGISLGAQITDLGISGYPSGLDFARGAPGNAGGGGTQHNAGGGGGSNVGAGGKGGNSYGNYSATQTGTCVMYASDYYGCSGDGSRDMGGLAGGTIPADARYLMAGGGGGAGDNNNSDDSSATAQSNGGNGGGVIFIRANSVAGNGTLLANGSAGQTAGRDGAGAGGAGGTVALATVTTALGGVTAKVNGGAGGDTGFPLRAGETQGTGGGGGGGAILLPVGGVLGQTEVFGGAAGLNRQSATVFNKYGSEVGNGGQGNIVFNNAEVPSPANCAPAVTVTKSTTTPIRFTTSTSAVYTITASNAVNRGSAEGVVVSDPALPNNFKYSSTISTALSGGAVRTVTTTPTPGSTDPAWGTFTLPGGSSVTIQFQAALTAPAVGVYQNAAKAEFTNPVRTTIDTGAASATYDAASGTGEDIEVFAPPRIVLEKWVRNVSNEGIPGQSSTFGVSSQGRPQQILEYCVSYRNDGGYIARNFVLTDAVPPSSLALLAGYGTNANSKDLGIMVADGVQVASGGVTPTGTGLTSDSDEAVSGGDKASLTQGGGLRFGTDLAAGAKGTVCFRTTIS